MKVTEPGGTPASVSVSVFSGVGLWTAWDSRAALGLHADWVTVQLDPEGGSAGVASPTELRQAGYRYVFGWQARASLGGLLKARTMGLDGYIGQAENEAEYQACLGLGAITGLPHALVGNVGDWWNSRLVAAQGWQLILEACEGADPGVLDRLDSKGYPVASVLYYATDEGRRVSLTEYRARYPTANWAVYCAETLSGEDRGLLA